MKTSLVARTPKALWLAVAVLLTSSTVAIQTTEAPATPRTATLHYVSASFRMRPLPEDLEVPTTTTSSVPPPPPASAPPHPVVHPRAAPAPSSGPAPTPGSARAIGQAMAAAVGWTGSQWTCLDTLWGVRESGWDVHNYNRGSGAYGIPQALPGSKMAAAGPNWHDDAATQIRWGLGYVGGRYGTPCAALGHSYRFNWY